MTATIINLINEPRTHTLTRLICYHIIKGTADILRAIRANGPPMDGMPTVSVLQTIPDGFLVAATEFSDEFRNIFTHTISSIYSLHYSPTHMNRPF